MKQKNDLAIPLIPEVNQLDPKSAELSLLIDAGLEKDSVVILPPSDIYESLELLERASVKSRVNILDPWYNKGVGGVRDDYVEYMSGILQKCCEASEHTYFWGFPEITALFVGKIPPSCNLNVWLTWFYKNNPSVIRGWRSSQQACLHITKKDATMHPEHFLNEEQRQKLAEGKMRFIPGPTSVIEQSLLVGFIGKKEQTGHPAQKPVPVYEKLILMGTRPGDLVVDLMAGSGTTGEAALMHGRKAILGDMSEEYTQIMEKRLGVKRIQIPKKLTMKKD